MKTTATYRGTTVTLLDWNDKSVKLGLEDPRRGDGPHWVYVGTCGGRTEPRFLHEPKWGPKKLMMEMAKAALASGTTQVHNYTFMWAR